MQSLSIYIRPFIVGSLRGTGECSVYRHIKYSQALHAVIETDLKDTSLSKAAGRHGVSLQTIYNHAGGPIDRMNGFLLQRKIDEYAANKRITMMLNKAKRAVEDAEAKVLQEIRVEQGEARWQQMIQQQEFEDSE